MPGLRRLAPSSPIHAGVLVVTALVGLVVPTPRPAVANTVTDIEVTTDEAGRTVTVVSAALPFDQRKYRSYHLDDPPRAVVLLSGIDSPYLPSSLPVQDSNVTTVRIGHHPEATPPELHVVFDLTSEGVEILNLVADGNRLTILIGRPGSQPYPTVTPVPSIAGGRPAPADPPPPGEQTTPTPTAAGSPPPVEVEPVVPDAVATETVATHVIDIAATQRGDGSTLLRVTADGQFPDGCARFLKVADTPPRVVLSIRGVSAPELPRSIEIDDPILTKIRLIHDAEVADGELHLVLHLTDATATVAELKQVGPNLVLRLVAGEPSSPTP